MSRMMETRLLVRWEVDGLSLLRHPKNSISFPKMIMFGEVAMVVLS